MTDQPNQQPIAGPVRLLGRQILDSENQGVCEIATPMRTWDSTDRLNKRVDEIGEYVATCINEHESLLATNARLKKEVAAANKGAQTNARVNELLTKHVNDLKATNARLLEALREIDDYLKPYGESDPDCQHCHKTYGIAHVSYRTGENE